MAADAEKGRGGVPWRMVGWSLPVVLLAIPLLARWPWTTFDFIFMGVLFGAVGLTIEGAVRASRNLAYRFGAGVAVLTAFLLIWVNGAVGVFGSEDNPANLMLMGVVALGAVASALARFRAPGMVWAMGAAGAAQLAVVAGVLIAGWQTPGLGGAREALLASGFAILWLVAAGLFRRAAEDGGKGPVAPRT